MDTAIGAWHPVMVEPLKRTQRFFGAGVFRKLTSDCLNSMRGAGCGLSAVGQGVVIRCPVTFGTWCAWLFSGGGCYSVFAQNGYRSKKQSM